MDIQQQKRSKILLVGDACIDRYVFGVCDRLSPEAPVPIIRQTKSIDISGMSGNVFSNIVSMSKNIEVDLDWIRPDPATIVKTRFIDLRSKNHLLRYDVDPMQDPAEHLDERKLLEYDLIVISDYDKGFLTREEIESITSFAKCRVLVDTKKKDLSCFHKCLIKINEQESNLAKNINDTCDLIVTMGSSGALYKGKTYETKKVDAHDVCGAGDVFLSALAVRLIETNDLDKAIRTANSCASHSVTKIGTYTVTSEEYENLRV